MRKQPLIRIKKKAKNIIMTVNRREFIKKTGVLGIGSLVFTLLPSQAAYFIKGRIDGFGCILT